MEKRIVVNVDGRWAHICPKCGESLYTECEGEDRIYNGNTAEVAEWYHCNNCKIDFDIITEMRYKYHIIDEK